MKTEHDKFTVDFLTARRGRPPKLHPRTAAQRTADWRKRKKTESIANVTNQTDIKPKEILINVTCDIKSCTFCGVDYSKCCGLCNVGQLGYLL